MKMYGLYLLYYLTFVKFYVIVQIFIFHLKDRIQSKNCKINYQNIINNFMGWQTGYFYTMRNSWGRSWTQSNRWPALSMHKSVTSFNFCLLYFYRYLEHEKIYFIAFHVVCSILRGGKVERAPSKKTPVSRIMEVIEAHFIYQLIQKIY